MAHTDTSSSPMDAPVRGTTTSSQKDFSINWACCWLATVALVILDVGVTLVTGEAPASILELLVTGLALGGWVALFLTCVLVLVTLVARAMNKLPGALVNPLTGAWYGACCSFAGLLALKPWELLSDPYRLDILLIIGGPVAGATVGLLWGRLPKSWLVGALAVGAGLMYAADLLIMPGLYLTLHAMVACLAVLLSLAAARIGLGDKLGSRALLALLGVCLLSQTINLKPNRSDVIYAAAMTPKFLNLIQSLVDLDRDGFSPVFAGGDCNDLEASVHPGAVEIPGNGVDDNCNGLIDPEPLKRPTVAARTPRAPRPDIYIILLDALRADMLGLELSKEAPRFSQLTASAISFQAAYTTYPSTYRAMTSLFQSRPWRCVDPTLPLFYERLASQGYDVQLWLRDKQLAQKPGGKGPISFDRSVGDPFKVPRKDKETWTAKMVDNALQEARQDPEGEPRLRWLQVFDTHAPHLRGGPAATPEERYRAEARYTLEEMARLISGVRATPRGENAVFIVAADHGEAFGEHNNSFHGAHLYEETIRVPLFMWFPGQKPALIEETASLLDIVPTLAAYLGLEEHPSWMGHNWLAPGERVFPVITQTEPVDNWAGLGRPEQHAVLDTPHKLIFNVDQNLIELYDLSNDPGERHNQAQQQSERRDRLHLALKQWQDRPGCKMGLRK